MSGASGLRPAKTWGWVIRAVQTILRIDLSRRNRVHIPPPDLEVLRGLPPGMGLILPSNHADEKDFEVSLDLSTPPG